MENGKKREWVKNAIIIFLIVMLILTLFSNTIMNYSLPEVSAQYTSSGQITNKVRGSAVVETADPYSLEVKEARKIASVKVRTGDSVEVGDVIYELEDGESEELKEEITKLEQLESEYEKAVIEGEIERSTTRAVESGNTGTLESNQAKLENAKNSVESWEKKLESLKNQQTQYGYEKQYKDSTEDLKEERDKWSTQYSNDSMTLSSAQTAYDTARETHATNESNYTQAKLNYDAALAAFNTANDISGSDPTGYDDALADLNTATDTLTLAKNAYDSSASAVNTAKASLDNAIANANYSQQQVKNYEEAIKNAQHAINDKDYNLSTQIANAEASLEKAKDNYSKLKTELANMYGLEDKLKAINDQKEKVEKMQKESTGATITSPVAGTILTLKYVAGETTEKGGEVATIQKAGKGFTMSMPVSKEQAKYVSIGDEAEVSNSWWYSDIHARVREIRPDATNPGSKNIIFEVEGEDLMSGTSLSITVGNKTANYDIVVPTSAIKEDNDGKYIYKIESKSTPFGNRYVAKRVNVTVLAEGDTESAVSGDLIGWDYIITTASKPVEDGQQVRLKD